MKHAIARGAAGAITLALVLVGADLPPRAQAQAAHTHQVREIEVVVDGGFAPQRIEIREGEHVRLKFLRKSSQDCASEVVFPQLSLRRELPPEQAIVFDLPSLRPGEYGFTCGMKMIAGTLVVRANP